MAAGKLPPRQKMIGLMYLVLLALLAMNVSKSILESFVVINNGIEITTKTFDASNSILYSAFDKAAAESPAAKPWAKKASEVKKTANDMYNHIEKIKKVMYQKIDALPEEVADTIPLASISAKDNYDEPSRLMGLADPGAPGAAPDCEECSSTLLKDKLNKFRGDLVAMFSKEEQEMMSKKLNFLETNEIHAHDGDKPWEVGMFYHNPLAAVVTTLSKIQSDIRTAEAEVINKLYENIDAGGVSFNNVVGMAVLPKAYIMDGDSFSADIFTAAYDDRADPEIYIGKFDSAAALAVEKTGKFDVNKVMQGTKGNAWGEGDWYQMSKEDIAAGKGFLKIKESIGVHDWGGIIKLNTKKGPKVYPFKSSFEVGKPSLAISADKMNVFYIGVDNPVSIAAPMPNFTASAPGLSKKGKGWVMRPRKPGKVSIVVNGIDDSGKKINLGKSEFRVKRIPDPKSYCAGKSGSVSIKKIALKSASTVQAKMDNFDFDIKVKVSSFMFSTTKSGVVQEFKVSGNKLNSKCKDLISRAKKNQKFFIEKIKVKMPDGSTRQLAPIILKTI